MPTPLSSDDLTLDEIRDLQDRIGPTAYMARVMALFRSGHATAAQWEALAEAILLVSESSLECLITTVDKAVLASVRLPGQEG